MASQATIIHKTVKGAAWTVLTSVGSRIIGALGAIVVTWFISPEIAGQVKVAYVLVTAANVFSMLGIGQYVAAKPKESKDVVWHATVLHLGIGIPAILAAYPIAYAWSLYKGSADIMAYVPGLMVAVMLERLHIIPERVLTRELNFRPVGLARGFAELIYTFLVVGLAMNWQRLGFQPTSIGFAIVYANIGRYVFMTTYNIISSNRRVWLTPAKWSWKTVRAIFGFGIPMSIAHTSTYASRELDTLIFSKLFSDASTGQYDKAYNLADIPAVQVGEQISDVLLPSFAQMEPTERKSALIRSTALLSLIIFPLAMGLGATADTLIKTILKPDWWEVAPMLTVLSGLAIVRPVGWTIMSYLQACDRPKTVMVIGAMKVIVLLVAVAAFGIVAPKLNLSGPLFACVGVSVGFLFHALAGMWVVRRKDQISWTRFASACTPPLIACLPMVGAVLGTRWLWNHLELNGSMLNLVTGIGLSEFPTHALASAPGFLTEVIAGILIYIPCAMIFARKTSKDLIGLVKDQIRARRGLPPVNTHTASMLPDGPNSEIIPDMPESRASIYN